ncbi:hypothetical protein [Thalassospira alkalitolerans]|uniref:hypothetical protein n=1 Tax=Thalassospira alkalitolerans TaxID=1293890 RepID=UPI003AA9732C
MIKKLVAMAALMLLAGCVTATSKFEEEMPVGTVLTGVASAPQGDILLPPGNWTVVGKNITRNNSYQAFGHVVLARIGNDKHLNGLIMYMTALETGMGYAFYSSSYCDPDSDTIYHHKSSNQELGNQKCFFIEDWNLNVSSQASPEILQAEVYFDLHDIKKPSSMLFTSYRVARRNKLLIAQYGFNYRQTGDEMLPGYTPASVEDYGKPFGTALWKENLETVIAWSKENEDLIATTFLD